MLYSPQIHEGCIFFERFAKGIQNKDTGPHALQKDNSSAII